MLHRRYPDGIVVFDPDDGATRLISGDALEIVDMIGGLVHECASDPDQLLARAVQELNEGETPIGSDAVENLKSWIRLALRMQK